MEAKELLLAACPTNQWGEHVAEELAQEQTLENLELFSQRLERTHEVLKQHGRCTCKAEPMKPMTKRKTGAKTKPVKRSARPKASRRWDCHAGEKCRSETGAQDACDTDSFCHGCGAYLCDACAPDGPWGAHTPKEHLAHANRVVYGEEVID